MAICVDDLSQAGHKASNLELLKALEEVLKMSTSEHLGPQDPDEKLMITRAKARIQNIQEGRT
eukprot:3909646-Prorocentrum_lima.AAC.1